MNVVRGKSIIRVLKVRYCSKVFADTSPVGTASGSEILSQTDPPCLFPGQLRISVLCRG
jgi:hypothetical protein